MPRSGTSKESGAGREAWASRRTPGLLKRLHRDAHRHSLRSGEGFMAGPTDSLFDELQAPPALRRFGSGWYAGLFGLLLAIASLAMVLVLRFPGWLGMPELAAIRESTASGRPSMS